MSNSPHRPDTANSLDTTRERRPGENFKHYYQRMMMEGRQREAIPPDRHMIEMLAVVGPLEGKTFPPPGDKDKTGQSLSTTSAKSTSTPVPKPLFWVVALFMGWGLLLLLTGCGWVGASTETSNAIQDAIFGTDEWGPGYNPPGGWAWQYNNAHTVILVTP